MLEHCRLSCKSSCQERSFWVLYRPKEMSQCTRYAFDFGLRATAPLLMSIQECNQKKSQVSISRFGTNFSLSCPLPVLVAFLSLKSLLHQNRTTAHTPNSCTIATANVICVSQNIVPPLPVNVRCTLGRPRAVSMQSLRLQPTTLARLRLHASCRKQ